MVRTAWSKFVNENAARLFLAKNCPRPRFHATIKLRDILMVTRKQVRVSHPKIGAAVVPVGEIVMRIEATIAFEWTSHRVTLQLLSYREPVIEHHLVLHLRPATNWQRDFRVVLDAFRVSIKRDLIRVLRSYAAQHFGEVDCFATFIVTRNDEFESVSRYNSLHFIRSHRSLVVNDAHHTTAIEQVDAFEQFIHVPFPHRAFDGPDVIKQVAPRCRCEGPEMRARLLCSIAVCVNNWNRFDGREIDETNVSQPSSPAFDAEKAVALLEMLVNNVYD